MSSLPHPPSIAQAHSEQVRALILSEIKAAGGWLPFSQYMELALYAPGLGYYTAGNQKFGPAGDFTTAPEQSRLFGRTLAQQMAQVLAETGGDILELGAGSGRLAVDLLVELERLDKLPAHYCILELSGELRARQFDTLSTHAPHLVARVSWLDTLPENFTGVIFGNEVLDAMPVHIVSLHDGNWFERGVTSFKSGFEWQERPLTPGALQDAAQSLAVPEPYVTEINLAAPALIASLAERLTRGLLLFVDYGFPHSEYYHPQRNQGTLMCHYQHQAHADPFLWPGLQDITAHVDFSAIADAGIAHRLDLLGFTSQAHFLINCGITDLLSEVSPSDTATYLPLSNQVQTLLSPAEMGELFKVIALGKAIDARLFGFARGHQQHRL